jgi:predicted DNA-binding protein (MmcQ/YjbR family)
MLTIAQARKMALSLPGAEEKPHFHLTSFRIKNKIFATLHTDKNYVMVNLLPIDQSVFCAYNKEIIFPVPGGWGKKGATFINLKKVPKSLFQDALTTAWKKIASPGLIEKYKDIFDREP